MSDYPLIPLRDLCTTINSGGTPSRREPGFWMGGTIPWIKTGELNDWKVQSIEECITEAGLDSSSAKLYPSGTILIAMYGDGRTITTMGIVDIPAATNQACCALIANSAVCDPIYLFYALKERRHELLNLVVAGAQRNLSVGTIRNFPVRLPPLPTQRRIATILRGYDDLIEVNQRRTAILENMARRLFDQWFIRFRFPGHEAVPVVETELGMLPEGWRAGTVQDVVILQRGFDLPNTQRSEGPYPVIAATGEHGFHNEFKVHGPGIVTGRSGSLGKVMHISGDFWPLNTTLWGKDYPLGSTYFAYFTVSDLPFGTLNAGAAVPSLNRNHVHLLPQVIPSRDVVMLFDKAVDPMFTLKRSLLAANARLRTTRDLLLPRLISGEIDVSVAEETFAEAAE